MAELNLVWWKSKTGKDATVKEYVNLEKALKNYDDMMGKHVKTPTADTLKAAKGAAALLLTQITAVHSKKEVPAATKTILDDYKTKATKVKDLTK